MRKILLIVDNFPPYWSPRIGYLVKNLSLKGYQFDVLSGTRGKKKIFFHLSGYERSVLFFKEKEISRYSLKNIIDCFMPMRSSRREHEIYSKALELGACNVYDIVMASTCGTFPAVAACRVAYKLGLPFILDVRDMEEQRPKNYAADLFRGRSLDVLHDLITRKLRCYYRDRVLKSADSVVTISPFHEKLIKETNSDCKTIYNGFDEKIFFRRQPSKTNLFRIVYTGTLATVKLRDPSFLVDAVCRLKSEGVISENSFRCEFYVGAVEHNNLREMIRRAGIEGFFTFHEFVAAEKVPEILSSSSILLVLAAKAGCDGPNGILTTKLFEYLGAGRPILCVQSDESYIENIIKDSGSGVAARTGSEAYEFILKMYREWEELGYTKLINNKQYVKRYSRQSQAVEFLRVIESSIESKRRD